MVKMVIHILAAIHTSQCGSRYDLLCFLPIFITKKGHQFTCLPILDSVFINFFNAFKVLMGGCN